ncbi:HAAS signaling domain-containing protein [Qaidamihabitans albus]|uniref:HAAS signaling domain-containing protein n=1 Tax=Qaidamihabitans albus TaxID=2795733 RepID=UPI0018F1BF44|nr:hypothetical protein [Qaidamihabitans albus]
MTTAPAERYIDNLIIALQLRGVPGEKIGQIVAEVEAHVAESGEDPGDAFGKPREYARTWARDIGRPVNSPGRIRNVLGIAACAAGGWFLAIGVLRTFTDETVWGLHALVSVVIGVALLVGGLLTVQKNVVIDPRTGLEPHRLKRAARRGFVIAGSAVLLFVAAAIVIGVALE